ncbi:MAG: UvrB/UvrC motif-containing protein [Chitinivibrionia bacterium]|nr:UvrB/UvrC motif-containing protein [Chitinivibrionia bacterium]
MMICEKCGKPAISQITSVVNGKKEERHYCGECFARIAPFGNIASNFNLPIMPIIQIEEISRNEEYEDDGLNENGVPYEYDCGDDEGCCGGVPAFLQNMVMSFAGDLFGRAATPRSNKGDASLAKNQAPKGPIIQCSGCGISSEDVEKMQKAGCAKCYSTFENILMKKHNRFSEGKAYSGKYYSPKIVWNDIEHLQSELNLAVKNQNFELAAKIRDGMKTLQTKRATAE